MINVRERVCGGTQIAIKYLNIPPAYTRTQIQNSYHKLTTGQLIGSFSIK